MSDMPDESSSRPECAGPIPLPYQPQLQAKVKLPSRSMKARTIVTLLGLQGVYPLAIGIIIVISEIRKPGPDWDEACMWAGLLILLGFNVLFFCLRWSFGGLWQVIKEDTTKTENNQV